MSRKEGRKNFSQPRTWHCVAWVSAALLACVQAKGSGMGSGNGGMYWAFIVLGFLAVGAVGYFAFQYWKRSRLQEKMAKDSIDSRANAIASYEDAKLQAFNKHFQRDLELAAKKRGSKVDPRVLQACDSARAGKRKEVFALIDNHTVDVNAIDEFGRSFLMIAAEIGDSRLCDGLLRRGADVNQRNKFNGATVLHFAYQYENDSLGLSLVARGADDTIRAIDGRTCYQLRDDDYDMEAGGAESEVGMAPAPRRDMNGGGAGESKGPRRKDVVGKGSKAGSRGGTRRNSNARYDKMGDPVQPPGVVPGSAEKYQQRQQQPQHFLN